MAFSFSSGSSKKESSESKSTVTTSKSSNIFADDDEETWKKLVSGDDETDSAGTVGPLLSSLTERLKEDWKFGSTSDERESFWNELVKQGSETLSSTKNSYQSLDSNTNALGNSSGDSSLPEAFSSENGKKHLDATTALLGLSKKRALQVTMGALRSVDTAADQPKGNDKTKDDSKPSDNYSSLLGTRELLAKTVAYHHKQRSARLSVLAECLRIEQDPSSKIHTVIADTVLDPLEALVESKTPKTTLKRGLFKNLLVTACQPDPTPKREALEPAKNLSGSYSTIASTGGSKDSDASVSIRFSVDLFSEVLAQRARERTQAMEGLLALLYQRLDGGIHQLDLGILLAAMFGNISSTRDDRWHQLAGLVCAECMALWRAFDPPKVMAKDARGNPTMYESWTKSHPLMEGFAGLQGIAELLNKNVGNESNKCSLSLARLSFGLLLCLASDGDDTSESNKFIRLLGMNLVTVANDEGGAFDSLKEVIAKLTSDTLSDAPAQVAHEGLYDWQLFSAKEAALANSLSDKTISADVVAYTSIAREILAASIASFSENLLAIDRTDSSKNIGMLSQLVAVVFRNNKPLCLQFWESWESYLSRSNNQSSTNHEFPVCRLLDASYNLSREYLSGFFNGQIAREEFLEATAPFFRLLSVLCHTPDICETMIEMLPPTLIRATIQCCASDRASPSEATSLVLESFQGLTKIASSSSTCLSALRRALEDPSQVDSDDGDFYYQGPLLLASLLNSPIDSKTTSSILGAIANLLKGAPQGWAVPMAQQFVDQANGSGNSATSKLVPFVWTNEEVLSHSAILVVEELIGHMNQIVFGMSSNSGYDVAILAFLQSLGAALLTSMTSLATARISTASVETAEIVFRSLTDFLKGIKPIVRLHPSFKVKDGASKLRQSLIQTLATSNGLGEVLVYYSTAPVSMGLLLKMEETVLDQAIAEQVARDDDSEAAQKYGAWYTLSSSYKGHSSGASLSKAKVAEFLSRMNCDDFDLAGVRARGWTKGSNPNGVATLDASKSAIRLLSEWASTVEDIAQTTHGTSDDGKTVSSEADRMEVLKNWSPQKLVCTMAPMPVQCGSDARMSALWQSLEVSTFDLLLPYLHDSEENSTNLPLPNVLNLLNACLSHLRQIVPKGELATSLLLRTIVQSTRFSSLLGDIIERGIMLAGDEGNSKALSEVNQRHYQQAFLSLQLLSSCVASAPTVAHAILDIENDSKLSASLVKGALYAKKVLDLTGSADIFTTGGSILQIRIASGCLNVLSALWKSTTSLSQGKTSDGVASALLKKVDEQLKSLVPDLVGLVSDYANSNNLEDRIAITNSTEFGRVSTISYMTSALEILANALMYESSKDGGNSSRGATLGILTRFLKSRRLVRSKNYALSVTSTNDIWEISEHAGLEKNAPLSLLTSFPASASYLQPDDFYTRENSFDLDSLAKWLTSIGGEDSSIISGALDKASLLHHLMTAELHLIEAWKKFVEIAAFKEYISNGSLNGPTLEILKILTLDTLYGLRDNLKAGASAQTGFATPFMNQEICSMSNFLGDLLLFQLEIGAFNLLPLDELLDIARALAEATKSLQDVACPEPTGEDQSSLLEAYCGHHQTLLSCSLVVCGLIEKQELSRSDEGVQGDIYLSLCMTNCKFMRAFSQICKQDNICEKAHTTMIRSCAGLFTRLVIGYQGDKSSSASFTAMLSNSFKEYEVLKLLMQYATFLSAFAADKLSSSTNSDPSAEEREILDVIKEVFNLLHAIAETNDPQMIETLQIVELSQLVVRNPLFNLRAPIWSQRDLTQVQSRGYVFKREFVNQKPIYVGSEDPVYEIWLASMQVLGASVRTSSHYLKDVARDNSGTTFLNMSIEFLQVYKVPLLVCLESCVHPSKMTRFALREAKVLVAMVAELCKRNVRTSFVSSNLQLCEEFLEHSKITIMTLSSFLGAVGTSCELFAVIDECESTDQDQYETLKANSMSPLRRDLLKIGLPMATQKAMRLTYYASSRLKKVSQEDFQATTVFPENLNSLSQKKAHDPNSELICRRSVTNEFSLGLVRASAEIVGQALSLVHRTHPTSKSFYMFSEAENSIDCMNLVEPGIVIGYRPNIGQNMLFDSSGFERLRFGRVLRADTFSRTWEVEVIREDGNESEVFDGRKEIVQAAQLAGMEDKSTRKPSTVKPTPAPESMEDFENIPGYLTTGNYIMILRWCHQQKTLLHSENGDKESETDIQKIAEQASILLGADLVLHRMNGSFQKMDKKELSKLDAQMFELFADKAALLGNLENEGATAPSSFQEGRMKDVLDECVWKGLQSQVRPFVERAWKLEIERERKRREKRMNSGDSEFFSGFRRKGKSAFRR